MFICTNFAVVPLVYFFYPETSNITHEENDQLFLGADPVKHSLVIAKRKWGQNGVDDMESAKEMGQNKAVEKTAKLTEKVALESD